MALTLVFLAAEISRAGDIFDTGAPVSSGPAAALLGDANPDPCRRTLTTESISLFDAIDRALCDSPKTQSAWAGVKAAAANVGISQSAYLPTLSADVRYAAQHNDTETLDEPRLRSDYTKGINQETLSLGWVLYDFGSRASSLRSSRELFLAAQANQSEALQAVFASTAKDYFAAQAANATLLAERRFEAAAQEVLDAATARVSKGVVPITDQLQAETAVAQATYRRAKAEGDYRMSIAAVAIDMSLSPEEALQLPELETQVQPDTNFVRAVHDLLVDARETHPRILTAAAQWQAALANVRFARAQGLPVLKLVGAADRSNQPVSASLGQPALPALTRENYIGLKIEIPLFEGFSRGYQIYQAEAQAEVKQQGLREAQQQVAINIFTSVQTLQIDTENLHNADRVLQLAKQQFDAAQHRYQSNVGNILELLSAQNILSQSEQLWIHAQLDWRTARLQVAASLGNLGMWALR